MKMIIKSLVAVGVLSLSAGSFAAATQGCNGDGVAASVTGSSSSFIINSFELKCSANVFLSYDPALNSNTKVSVCAGSKKGNKAFGGTSEGGAVKEQKDLTTAPAAVTDVGALASGCVA